MPNTQDPVANNQEDKVTALRLQVLKNGYVPLPNRAKQPRIPAWNKVRVTEELVRSWPADVKRARDTGIRCETIAVIDRDIVSPELFEAFDQLLQAYLDEHDLGGHLRVVGNAPKDKLVFAMPEAPVTSGCSQRWVRCDPEALDIYLAAKRRGDDPQLPGPSAMVEILGVGRQIGAFGTCGKRDVPLNGGEAQAKVAVQYRWDGKSPLEVPVDTLPQLTAEQAIEVMTLFDDFMESREGWLPVARGFHSNVGGMPIFYDLTSEMIEDATEGEWTLEDLKAMDHHHQRVTLGGKTRSNGEIYAERGEVTLINYLAPESIHKEPRREVEEVIEELAKRTADPIDGRTATGMLRSSLEFLVDKNITMAGKLAQMQPASGPNIDTLLAANRLRARVSLYGKQIDIESTHRPWADDMDLAGKVRCVIDAAARMRISNGGTVRDVLLEQACVNLYSPVADWIAAQSPWDGVDRFEELTARITFAEHQDASLARRLLKMWLLQAYQAATGWRRPQAVGHVLTLIGAQGIGKSRFAHHLVPEELGFYAEGCQLNLGGFAGEARDSILLATTCWLAELAELPATKRRSSTNELKKFLTASVDRVRLPYAKETTAFPRATVYLATSNDIDVLKDMTGSRRFWPVSVERIEDVSNFRPAGGLAHWQGQLWRQVESWAKDGEVYWPDDELAARLNKEAEHYTEMSGVAEALASQIDIEASVARHAEGPGTDNPDSFLSVANMLQAVGYVSHGSYGSPMDRREATAWLIKHVGRRIPRLSKDRTKRRVWGVVFYS